MSDDQPNDTMFQDAVDALRRGDKPRAKELLTLLLNTDQTNATYWIWLSAAVDNKKERIYCLQTAYKLNPENGTAKRGLILLGALVPDESIQPFPMNRPRAWEEKLLLANEKPKEKGFRTIVRNPAMRLVGVVLVGAALFSAVLFGFVLPRQTNIVPTQSVDQYRSAKMAYENGDWDAYIASMELIIPLEPDAADIHYLIGEAYRFKGDVKNALNSYNDALKIDPNFGAPYLGLARARLFDDPDLDVEYLFNEALDRDPNFGEIYIERARYFLYHQDPKSAIVDLNQADKLMPDSPMVYMAYADAYLALEDKKNALEAAEKAFALDATDPLVYKMLGTLYIENGEYERAIETLNVYVIYANENDRAFALLGRAYFEFKDYKTSVENFDKAEELNPNGMRKYYIYRGLANLELDNIDQAVDDLENALSEDDTSFEINLGLARAYFIQEKFGSAFLRAETLKALAETDEETALALYWHALSQEKRGEIKDAVKNWQALLKMDKDVMTAEMRAEAEQHLKAVVTPTNTSKPVTATPTKKGGTATPTTKSGTATPTTTGQPIVVPSRTPTP